MKYGDANLMNPAVKAKWVEALKSGEYEQTRSVLKAGESFCCLGVLCDLHSKETGQGVWEEMTTVELKDKSPSVYADNCALTRVHQVYRIESPTGNIFGVQTLPKPVSDWAGLSGEYVNTNADLGACLDIDGTLNFLTIHNDEGKTFVQIAEAIDGQL